MPPQPRHALRDIRRTCRVRPIKKEKEWDMNVYIYTDQFTNPKSMTSRMCTCSGSMTRTTTPNMKMDFTTVDRHWVRPT